MSQCPSMPQLYQNLFVSCKSCLGGGGGGSTNLCVGIHCLDEEIFVYQCCGQKVSLWGWVFQGILGPIVLKVLNAVGETRPNRQTVLDISIKHACYIYRIFVHKCQ
jgi:hypothetical protein